MSLQPQRHNSEHGFTLIEILLAVALVATIAALVFGSLATTLNAIDVARGSAANGQIVRTTMRLMADELSMGVSSQVTPWMGVNAQQDNQPADTIVFLTMGQFRGAESEHDTEIVRIVYTRERDKLLRLVRRNLYGLTDESLGQLELLEKVKGFNVRYYDAQNKLWVDEWDGRARSKPPGALLIELTLQQDNVEPQTFRHWVTIGASS
ncbi:MAG TPA: type II secretion system protein GspJ [Nitrospiraceae bacterium]|nr:type II secretion system protein GspJ [Nitrospiraceae bacterium]